jgi:pimeloyl-ACP methyl ester carboxylesterase
MIQALQGRGHVPGRTLFGLPYNFFDHNIIHVDALARLVERAFNASGGQKVHLVAHSMGNLPTKLYLALCPEHASRYVASWTALGPPFLGAGAAGYGHPPLGGSGHHAMT